MSRTTTANCDVCGKVSTKTLTLRYWAVADLCDECMATPQVKKLNELNEEGRRRDQDSALWQQTQSGGVLGLGTARGS